MVSRWLGVALATALLCGGCSLALNWDEGQLTCGPNADPNYAYACLSGFTCDPPYCVADNSRAAFENCSNVQQCQSGDLCPLSYIGNPCNPNADNSCEVCVNNCGAASAYSGTACGAGEFCALSCSVPSTYNGAQYVACDSNKWIGGCSRTSTCAANTTCSVPGGSTQGICVSIRADGTSKACLPACSFTNSGTTITGDTCGGTASNPLSCVPVGGMPFQQQFVCMPQGKTPGALNQPCDPSRPCASTLACLPNANNINVCLQLCGQINSSTPCASTPSSTGAASTNCTAIPNISQQVDNGTGTGTTGFNNSMVGYCL